MKNKTHIPTDNIEKQSFSKRFLLRKVEEQEAKEIIKDSMQKKELPQETTWDKDE